MSDFWLPTFVFYGIVCCVTHLCVLNFDYLNQDYDLIFLINLKERKQ